MAAGLMAGLLLWTLLCVALAWRYPSRARAAVGPTWEATLRDDFDAAEGDAARVAAVNGALRDVEHDLDAARRLPVTAAWLALNGWLLLTLAGLVFWPEPALAASVPIGLLGLMGTLSARRRGRQEAEQGRRRADALVAAVAGELAHREVAMPARRRHRGGRFRRKR